MSQLDRRIRAVAELAGRPYREVAGWLKPVLTHPTGATAAQRQLEAYLAEGLLFGSTLSAILMDRVEIRHAGDGERCRPPCTHPDPTYPVVYLRQGSAVLDRLMHVKARLGISSRHTEYDAPPVPSITADHEGAEIRTQAGGRVDFRWVEPDWSVAAVQQDEQPLVLGAEWLWEQESFRAEWDRMLRIGPALTGMGRGGVQFWKGRGEICLIRGVDGYPPSVAGEWTSMDAAAVLHLLTGVVLDPAEVSNLGRNGLGPAAGRHWTRVAVAGFVGPTSAQLAVLRTKHGGEWGVIPPGYGPGDRVDAADLLCRLRLDANGHPRPWPAQLPSLDAQGPAESKL